MSEFGRHGRGFNEYGRYSEFGNTSDLGKDMSEQAEEIKRLLDSITLSEDKEKKEVNRDAIYGIDQEAARKGEKREFRLSSGLKDIDITSSSTPNNPINTEEDYARVVDEATKEVENSQLLADNLRKKLGSVFGSTESDTHKKELDQMMSELSNSSENNNSKIM